jgi:hypothetical protein
VRKQGQAPRTAARGSGAAVLPRPVAFARRLFVLSGVLSAAYIGLAVTELDRLAAGRVIASPEGGAAGLTNPPGNIRDLTVYTIGLAVVTTATMLPFALLVRRAPPWARNSMIIICVTLITMAVVLITADATAIQNGWLPVLHYATSGLTLAAAIGGVIGLSGADTGAYFRRHQQVAEGDPRLWPISRLRDLQTARFGDARSGTAVIAPTQSALPLEVASTPPAYEAFARAA